MRIIMDRMAKLDSNIASVEMEGFVITSDDRELAIRCMNGSVSYDDAISQIVSGTR